MWVRSLVELDNGYLASGSDDASLKIWDITNGKLKFTIDNSNQHFDSVQSLASLEGNGFVASGSFDETIKIWDLENKF